LEFNIGPADDQISWDGKFDNSGNVVGALGWGVALAFCSDSVISKTPIQ
jgi:hypothetical protein